jgi:hypothetical protein
MQPACISHVSPQLRWTLPLPPRPNQEDGVAMTEREFQAKLAELDRLLNDPEIRMDPDRVWALLAEISAQEMGATARA